MCGSSGGTQTQVKELPAWAQPYAENLLQSGSQAINQPVQDYEGMRVAPMNQQQQAALSMQAGRALSGSPDEMAARQQAMATAQGGYLGANPWLNNDYTAQAINQNADAMGRAYSTGTAAQLDTAAARGRAFGNSGYDQQLQANQTGFANAVGNMANQYQLGRTGMGVQDWQTERNNMMQSVPLALQGAQADYTNAQKLFDAGGAGRQYKQQLLDQMYSDYQTQANRPFEQIDRAGNLLGMAIGNSGNTTSRTNQGGLNTALQLGGAGLGAYGLINLLKGGG